MARYVALLRGINVGGNNVIRMADLRACLEADGFGDVRTYIQSGNVLFTASGSSATLTARLERTLSAGFGYEATVAVRSARQFRAIVNAAPSGFGVDRERYRSDVIFLMPPLTPARAIADVPTREGVDRAWTGPGVLYFERLDARAAQSRLSKIVSLPIYRSLTIRNWATTCTLLEMLETPQG
jgi:uncharacterized protein (DUF1697 family)